MFITPRNLIAANVIVPGVLTTETFSREAFIKGSLVLAELRCL